MMGEPDFEEARNRLVARQLKARGIKDEKVLAAMARIPRHHFVPPMLQSEAYLDTPLPIGQGQTISQPYIVALMTEALEMKGGEKILEIGTGSGYQTAILAEIAGRVITIERITTLLRDARERLKAYGNVRVIIGDGSKGFAEEAPYDGIIVTAAASEVPPALIAQLAIGGRMIIPVGSSAYQQLLKITKSTAGILKEGLLDVRFVPLVTDDRVPYDITGY
jgi:protein-L-isoaspartate(D-aspartate) O-methyltransferase